MEDNNVDWEMHYIEFCRFPFGVKLRIIWWRFFFPEKIDYMNEHYIEGMKLKDAYQKAKKL